MFYGLPSGISFVSRQHRLSAYVHRHQLVRFLNHHLFHGRCLLLLISSPEVVELNSLDAISGLRSYGLNLLMSGKVSLSLSLDEESSFEDIIYKL